MAPSGPHRLLRSPYAPAIVIDGSTARNPTPALGVLPSETLAFEYFVLFQRPPLCSQLCSPKFVFQKTGAQSCRPSREMADAAKPKMDFRTMFFFAMTLSLCLNTVVCFIGSLGLPFVKAFTLVTYRAAH